MTRFFLVILITLILGILETTIASYAFLFLWVITFSMVSKEKESFWLAFLSGFWLDFLKAGILGETALIFLMFVLVVTLYKGKFKVVHPLYFFPFVALSVLVWEIWDPSAGSGQGFRWGGVLRVFWALVMAMGFLKLAQISQIKQIGRIEQR